MKKFLSVLLVLICFAAQAQFVNQLIYKRSFTPYQIDSVLSNEGIPSGIFPITYGAKAYKIVYNTVSWDSTATLASGLLIIPDNPPCKVSILSYQHGTTTKKNDVPSNFRGEWFVGLAGAAKGIMCVLPDYLGLGSSPGLHPYQHAHTEATATIDLIRAAKEVADSLGYPVNDQLFLTGYSQGGHATMAAHQLIQEQLDSVMHVTASAPMSGAYSMSGVMADVMASNNPYPSPYYLPYLFFGLNQVYHLYTNPSDVMVSPYDTLLPPLFDGTHSGGDVDAVMPTVPKLIMQPYQIDSFVNDSNNFFRVRLRENDTYNWIPTSPVRMYYCMGDRSVPYQNAIVAFQHFRAAGATLVDTFNVSATLDHYDCARLAILGGSQWIDSLLYGALSAHMSSTPVDDAGGTGSATAVPSGGRAPFTYSWNTGDTTATINAQGVWGWYHVTITDANLCTYSDSVYVQSELGIESIAAANVRVYPNPAQTSVYIESYTAGEKITGATAYSISGREVKTYSLLQGNRLQVLFDQPQAGVYYLHIKTGAGKEVRKKIVLIQP